MTPLPPLPCLAGARWLAEPGLLQTVEAVEAAGGAARIVGGAVRNALIGRPVTEVDVATTLPPDAVIAAVRAAGLKAVETGVEHGTVTVVGGGRAYEVTTLRRDVSTDGRRAVVAFTTDWAEDARRRDFTMNAIYCALDGTLHDPVEGYADLRAGQVRFIGNAEERIREDFLRILRFFRFHAEIGRGALDADGVAAAERLAPGLAALSRERVREELLRLIAAPGAVAAVETMVSHGILDALDLGRADLGSFEAVVAIEAALGRRADAMLRLAALVHDPADRRDADDVARRLRLTNQERNRLAGLEDENRLSPGLSESERRELAYWSGPGVVGDRVLMAWAKAGGAADDPGWAALFRFFEDWQAPAFPIKGGDLVKRGVEAGPRVGEVLARLERHWVEHGFRLGRAELLELAGTAAFEPDR